MHHLQQITEIALIIKQQGIQEVVIGPGSRNAPLMQVFFEDESFNCHSIVDERSAAYVALGMARELQKPVVLVTTSGTATLNLYPAIAEAFFQRIPLIVLTADRPHEWPSQFNNQIVGQNAVYDNNSKSSFSLSIKYDSDIALLAEMEYVHSLIRSANEPQKGPVHLNIPLKEPLYIPLPEESVFAFPGSENFENEAEKMNDLLHSEAQEEQKPYADWRPLDALADGFNMASNPDNELVPESEEDRFVRSFKSTKKLLIIVGIGVYSEAELAILRELVERFNVAVIAENLANLTDDSFIANPELVLAQKYDPADLVPDMVMVFGGQVVSKRVKLFVQGQNDFLEEQGNLKKRQESFEELLQSKLVEPRNVEVYTTDRFPVEILKGICDGYYGVDQNVYMPVWKQLESEGRVKLNNYLNESGFSNLDAVRKVLERVPKDAVIHAGNSGTVRYTQLFERGRHLWYANRGTSGIDGSLSTAVGAAMVSDKLHLCILGDLSFVYDSNALWNRDFPSNLKIVVLNDHGGGIFRLLKGPEHMSFFEELSLAHHPVNIAKIVEGYGHVADWISASPASELLSNNDGVDVASEVIGSKERDLDIANSSSRRVRTLDAEAVGKIGKLFTKAGNVNVLEVDTSECENSFIFKNLFIKLKKE